tara:strand:+ start:148 stop:936 length:789 start_codon:yes stop_codon:yes gene_type:complete
MGNIKEKVVLVTGGASGIGFSICKKFLENKALVILTDVDSSKGKRAQQELGSNAVFMEQDVSEEKRWKELIKTIKREYGDLKVLINNAGIAADGSRLEDCSLEMWKKIHSVNLDAVFLGTKYGIQSMKEKGGNIVNISSIMGIVGWPGAGPYNSSKAAVRMLTKVAALECADSGYDIRVNSVHPGFIDTPLVRDSFEETIRKGDSIFKTTEEAYEAVEQMQPLGNRLGKPEEIADAVYFLASDNSSFVTGTELVIDGGYTAK